MSDFIGGAILEVSEQDYLLGGSREGNLLELEDLPKIEREIIEYNQLEWKKEYGNCLCTIYAPLTMYSTNSTKKIGPEQRKKIVDTRYNLPDFVPSIGGYINVGVKIMIDETKDGIMYRTTKQEAIEIAKKGYMVNIGMHVGNDLKVASSDKVITQEEVKEIKDRKYGHSTCFVIDEKGGLWVDTYVGLKPNVRIENIDEFINSWFVYDWSYVIVPNKVIRDKFNKLIKNLGYKEALKYYQEISDKLYPREKQIFQYCLQMKYIGKLNSPKLKELVF